MQSLALRYSFIAHGIKKHFSTEHARSFFDYALMNRKRTAHGPSNKAVVTVYSNDHTEINCITLRSSYFDETT